MYIYLPFLAAPMFAILNNKRNLTFPVICKYNCTILKFLTENLIAKWNDCTAFFHNATHFRDHWFMGLLYKPNNDSMIVQPLMCSFKSEKSIKMFTFLSLNLNHTFQLINDRRNSYQLLK